MAIAVITVVVALILGRDVSVQALAVPQAGHICPGFHLPAPAVSPVSSPPGTQSQSSSVPGSASGETCHQHDATPIASVVADRWAMTTTGPGTVRSTPIGDATSHAPELPPPRA